MNAGFERVEAGDGLAHGGRGTGKLCDWSRFASLCLMEDTGTDFRIVRASVSRVVGRLWLSGAKLKGEVTILNEELSWVAARKI